MTLDNKYPYIQVPQMKNKILYKKYENFLQKTEFISLTNLEQQWWSMGMK